jgi:hypothetical protein
MSAAVLPDIILSTAVSQQKEGALSRWSRTTPDTPSVSIDEARNERLQSLREAFSEASQPGWDGYDASPVSVATLVQAWAFLELLPSALPRPEISANPDGELAFEWSFGPRWLLTVSVNESGRLSYAGLFGLARIHGTEWLLDSIPEPVALAFQRLHAAG